MNDLITAATSGLFVEVGKIIEHMKVQQARIADLERQLAEASAPAVGRKPNKTLLTVANDVRWACMKLYSPDDTATDWADKMAALDIRAIVEKVQPAAAPQAADTDKLREAILSILPNPPASLDKHESASYCVDFRAGLKAAAELVGSMAAQAPVREVPGWQPIETAPKDGTCILVCRAWDADGKPMGNSHRLFTHRAAWWADEKGGNGEWIVYNSMVKDPECFFTPTHWMPVPDIDVAPLPAAPVQKD